MNRYDKIIITVAMAVILGIVLVSISTNAATNNVTNDVTMASVTHRGTNVCSNCEHMMRKMERMMPFEGQTGLLMQMYMEDIIMSDTGRYGSFQVDIE